MEHVSGFREIGFLMMAEIEDGGMEDDKGKLESCRKKYQ